MFAIIMMVQDPIQTVLNSQLSSQFIYVCRNLRTFREITQLIIEQTTLVSCPLIFFCLLFVYLCKKIACGVGMLRDARPRVSNTCCLAMPRKLLVRERQRTDLAGLLRLEIPGPDLPWMAIGADP